MQKSIRLDLKEDAKSHLEFGRALQAENQSLREKLLRLGHSPAELQGLTAQSKSPRAVRVVRPSAQEIQQARDFLTSKYPDRCAFPKATSGESRLRDLLRSKLELQTCQEEVKKLEMEGSIFLSQVHSTADTIQISGADQLFFSSWCEVFPLNSVTMCHQKSGWTKCDAKKCPTIDRPQRPNLGSVAGPPPFLAQSCFSAAGVAAARVLGVFVGQAWWRRHVHSKRQVLNPEDELELDLVQGRWAKGSADVRCLLTAENLLNLGRVEKRTLFQVSAKKLLAKNEHLLGILTNAAQHCHEQSHNCLVTRWLPPNERYHILQASVNAMSSMFGPQYVHQNALGQSGADLFKSTWYCVTIMTPTRAENHLPSEQQVSQTSQSLETCTFTDMTRTPRPTLRIVIVHESEIRAIADGKLQPPSWGFFNSRHAERYRMLCDFSRNFQQQLIRTPADSSSMSSRSPFTSERTHKSEHERKPDGGMMKRVVSQPNLQKAGLNRPLSIDRIKGRGEASMVERLKEAAALADEKEKSLGASDENCFLRLHVFQAQGTRVSKGLTTWAPATSKPSRQVMGAQVQRSRPSWWHPRFEGQRRAGLSNDTAESMGFQEGDIGSAIAGATSSCACNSKIFQARRAWTSDAMRLQLHKASEAIRKADAEALAWRQARREVLQGGDAASASLKLAQASLLQKREQLKVLRLEVRRGQLS
ncbi:unnamed protein product, partial [Cladocopium goreaui]